MLTPRDLPLCRNSNTATTSTAPHSQGELNPNHVDEEEEKGEVESKEGEISDEGAPCWPKLYTTGIVPQAKSAPSARHSDAGSGREERAQTKVGRDNSMVENLFTHRRNHDGYIPILDPRGTRLNIGVTGAALREPCQAIRSGLNAYDGNGPSRTEQSSRLEVSREKKASGRQSQL